MRTHERTPTEDDVVAILRAAGMEPTYAERGPTGARDWYHDFNGRDLVRAYLLGWAARDRANG